MEATGRSYLTGSIMLSRNEDGSLPEEYFIQSVIGEGGSTVCYEAARTLKDGVAETGKLKEFYPIDAADANQAWYYSLERLPNGQLIHGAGSIQKFNDMCRDYLDTYKLLRKVMSDNPENEILKSYIQYGEILYGCAGNRKSTVYVWSPGMPGKGFDVYLSEIRKNPALHSAAVLKDILYVMNALTDCIKALHTAGLMHLDIKPSNFLVQYDSDFQIRPDRISLFDINTLSSVGSEYIRASGTDGFCAPEVKKGKADNRSDIYSIGAMLFHAVVITKDIPDGLYRDFYYSEIDRLVKHSELFCSSGTNSDSALMSRICIILEKCLAGNPKKRYQSCTELKADLDKAIHSCHLHILHNLEDDLLRKDCEVRKMREFIEAPDKAPNVHLEFKGDTENPESYPFYEKFYDVKKIFLLNFAATTFLSGCDIAEVYESNEYFRKLFLVRLINGEIMVEAVLTRPDSYAAIDAEKYKMYPEGANIEKRDIILHNLNKYFSLKEMYPHIRMNIYLTDIALPYGLMITEHKNPENNHMKVDLYAPVIAKDQYRPSFYLLKNNSATTELYTRFCNTFENIKENYSELYNLHANTDWIRGEKPIIHRGLINRNTVPHTRNAYLKCLKEKYPMEVDLLELADGTIIVGREDEIEKETGIIHAAGKDYPTLKFEMENSNREYGKQIMNLTDFLDLIHGYIPVLLEIKSTVFDFEDAGLQRLAENVVHELREYVRKYGIEGPKQNIAVHSSNPYILRALRERNCMIPIGQISLDFEKFSHPVAPEVLEMHKNRKYFEIVMPDFISYNIEHLPDAFIHKACKKYAIPLIGWTVRSMGDKEFAEYYCDNYIEERTYERN